MIRKTARYFARKKFCREAISERTDFSVIKEKLTFKIIIGLILIVISFLFVLPAFFVIGLIAYKLDKPVIGGIGMTVSYGFSWMLLMLGMYITGPDYAKTLGKWLTRVILEKILGTDAGKIASDQMEY